MITRELIEKELDPIDLSEYEYNVIDGSTRPFYAILMTSDNVPDVRRFLSCFGYECIEDNFQGILIWKKDEVVVPMDSIFGSYILISNDLTVSDYAKKMFEIKCEKVN